MRNNNHAARAARFLVQFFDVVCQMTTWNFRTSGSYDNVSGRKSFLLSLYMKTILEKQAKAHFTYFIQSDQHGLIAKHLS